MKNSFLIPLLLVPTCFISCENDHDDDDDTQTSVSYPDFAKLKVGNYWIYEEFDVDSSGNAVTRNVFDSCYVEKDTTVNGQVYFKYVAQDHSFPVTAISFLRDSLHYIVSSDGTIQFSSQNLTTVFTTEYILAVTDTVCRIESKMADINLSVIMPAGNFTTSNFQKTFYMYPTWTTNGNPRWLNSRYAENIGLVQQTFPFFSGSPNYRERRLVRYHLN